MLTATPAWVTIAVLAVLTGVVACSDAPETPSICDGTTEATAPRDLECTGLYADFTSLTLSARAESYTPALSFWSDGLDKRRYLELPDEAIDTTNPDEWVFPLGTKAWKEFWYEGRRIETRFFSKVASDRWVRATYVWSADQREAKRQDRGVTDVDGTGVDVPPLVDCDECHDGRKDKLLGVDAINLGQPESGGLTLIALNDRGKVSPPIARDAAYLPPMDGNASSAFLWLHTNCGVSCHSGGDNATAQGVDLRLNLKLGELAAAKASTASAALFGIHETTIDRFAKTPEWRGQSIIAPGRPSDSLLYELIAQRGEEQMPPIASRLVDPDGLVRIEAWIRSLPRDP